MHPAVAYFKRDDKLCHQSFVYFDDSLVPAILVP